ncbi:O-antigen ligase family protein [Actinoalloteichus caeruleus]|uniref:O-antigen ligase like membrane protein n=1 Tax=Actinoalloteichus caeruleus DSM 43889 TaxID=1120930 RepID=A0ABT1JNK5_ACTCY|nr:O-antigen ligase family protein [Actinoalloteichus caeruleus]MCP2333266.1 O-antigen ligase like membrane protein [Actinoalloteichus caeruleus DSM 43889]
MTWGLAERPVSHPLPRGETGTGRWRAPVGAVLAVFALLLALPQNLVVVGGAGGVTPARLLALACLLWWLVAVVGGLRRSTGANPVTRALLGFLVLVLTAHALATLDGGGVGADRIEETDRALLALVPAIGVALLASDGVRGRREVRWVLGALVLGTTASAGAAVVLFTVGVDPRPLLEVPGLELAPLWDADLARGGLVRAMGFAHHPIELAALAAMALPLAIHLAGHGRRPWLWWGCAALLALGVLTTISRTGLLGVAVVLVALLPRIGLRRWVSLGFGLVGALVVVVTAWPRLAEVLAATVLGSRTDNSVRGRLEDYTYVAGRLAEHPWWGQGFGTYLAPPQPYLDNQYLLTLVESGPLGLLGLLVLLATPLLLARRVAGGAVGSGDGDATGEATRDRDTGWALAVALLVGVCCLGTFDALAFPQFQGYLFLLIGLVGAVSSPAVSARARSPRSTDHPTRKG